MGDNKINDLRLRTFERIKSFLKMSDFADQRKEVESIDNLDSAQFQEFLDTSQYEMNKILRYEKIFGRGFISTGGITTTEKVQEKVKLEKGMKVLSVGCGIGGGECRMHKTYGVTVHGLDLSHNMLAVARLRAAEMGITEESVKFEHGNVLVRDFKEGSFDVVYSRDCIIHIREKKLLFERFYKWLKPGGQLLVSDYTCCPDEQKPKEFWAYLADRKYDLRPGDEYLKFITDAGFDARHEDMSEWFVEILQMEIKTLMDMKQEFLNDHSEQDFEDLLSGWNDKVKRVTDGTQTWSVFVGSKSQ